MGLPRRMKNYSNTERLGRYPSSSFYYPRPAIESFTALRDRALLSDPGILDDRVGQSPGQPIRGVGVSRLPWHAPSHYRSTRTV